MRLLSEGCSEASVPTTQVPLCPQPLFCFPVWLGVAPEGEEGHALSRKCCQRQSSSPDENDRRQPDRTAPHGGLGKGCTLQSPKSPRRKLKLPLSRRSGAAGQLWGSSAAQLQPAAQMCVFAQPSPGSEAALLSIMKGGL